MGRTVVSQSSNKHDVENKLTNSEAINEREIKAIAAGVIEELIPVKAEQTKKGIVIKSSITGMMSLKSYFSGIVSKKMFLDIISQIVVIVKECEKNLMNINNLMLDTDYIFIDPSTKKVRCIFWPIVNNQNTHAPSIFFNEIPFSVVFNKHENLDYVSSYLRYFKSLTPFSINSFEKLVLEMQGKTVENKSHIPSGSTGSTNPADSRGIFKNGESEGKTGNDVNVAYNPFSYTVKTDTKSNNSKVCPKCTNECDEKAKFCGSCGSPLTNQSSLQSNIPDPIANTTQYTIPSEIDELEEKANTQNFSETTVLSTDDMGGTTVLGADAYEEPTFPYLIREKTQEEISVNKPSFRIGKEKSFCDYFVSDNNAISRSHADIITKGERYYIIDNNSTNKTYVDNRVIPVKQEVEIFSGTKLKLANEEFVFYI